MKKIKKYLVLLMASIFLMGCSTDDIQKELSSVVDSAIEEGKTAIGGKVDGFAEDAKNNVENAVNSAINDAKNQVNQAIQDTIGGAIDGSIGIEIPDEIKNIASKYQFDTSTCNGNPYVAVNDNNPYFTDTEKENAKQGPFEYYSELDDKGRCGVAYANVGLELMPTEDRESISSVYPSGWNNKEYDFIDGKWIYNRSHLIGFQLTGENANEKNLITGTRYMNVQGMLPFENMIDDYVDETNNHVLYRVTPIFTGNNLVCDGVLMEAWSVEDEGDGICFNVFCYNVQPGVEIDYATGDNWLDGEKQTTTKTKNVDSEYILNTNSKKFHKISCANAESISEKNKSEFIGNRADLVNQGYSPCGSCKP